MTDHYPTRQTDAPTKQNVDPTFQPDEVPPPHTPLAATTKENDAYSNLPSAGETLFGFDLLRELGRGSFARVFLARQLALDRLVALKVSPNMGQEARTLAGLEHDHIVRVFSEQIDGSRDLCLMCMQYVPGTTLARVISGTVIVERAAMTVLAPSSLSHGDPPPEGWPKASSTDLAAPVVQRQAIPAGQAILELVDSQTSDDVLLDLGALRDRERLSGLDLLETVCWMGARLAEALAYAHARGVLHRDIKPANILINRYGRPLLVDFNVSTQSSRVGSSISKGSIGGTLGYMAPEHIDAFNPDNFTPAEAVDARSDIYSLGVVLYELLTGRLPFGIPAGGNSADVLQAMADQRRKGPPPLEPTLHVPPMFDRILKRCLAGNPTARYANAGDLASDLRNCLRMQRVQRDLPRGYVITPLAVRYPFLVGLFLVMLPHVLAAVVNIAYNWSLIVSHYKEGQHYLMFTVITICYNAVMWPFTLGMYLRQVVPVFRVWRKLASTEPVSATEVDAAQRRAVNAPLWGIVLCAQAWFLGGFVFPLGLYLTTGELSPEDAYHFLISFTLSGLVAMTYSVIAVEFLVLRVLYAGLWLDARNMRSVAQEELRPAERRLIVWQFLASSIPLIGAIMMIHVSPETFDVTFRYLVTGLLLLGMVGLGLTLLATGILRETIAVLISGSSKGTR